MVRNKPAFTSLGVENSNGDEPRYRYQINRSILLETAKRCTQAILTDRYQNEAVSRFGFTCAELDRYPDRTDKITGEAFNIWDIGENYLSVGFRASLLRALGIALKKSRNRAVASWGLTMLSDFDNWKASGQRDPH